MTINATIDNTEVDIAIIQKDNSGNWFGVLEDDPSGEILLEFDYSEGVITLYDINSVISTDQGIILERLINAFQEYTESHQMGFEVENINNSEAEELKPYDPEEIRVRPVVLSAFQVHRDISKGRIDLNPEFQRNFVWSDAQKSLLIESMLLKIPLPAFYFAEDKAGRYQVVDGLQRLTVINHFLNNGFKLKKLQYLHHLEGKYFSVDSTKNIGPDQALEEIHVSRIEGTQLNINVIEASSPLRVKYDIFYRINTGGRPLNRQEIRNCFATDKTRRLLKEMVNNEIFRKATGNSVKDTRMDAQELALRFCGFLLYRDEYVGEMNIFLDEILEKLNEKSENDLDKIKENFIKSLRLAYYLFGGYAFRKILPNNLQPNARRQFLNKAMFIAWTVVLADKDEFDIEMLFSEGQFAEILANKLSADSDLYDALTTGTTDRHNLAFVIDNFSSLLDNYML